MRDEITKCTRCLSMSTQKQMKGLKLKMVSNFHCQIPSVIYRMNLHGQDTAKTQHNSQHIINPNPNSVHAYKKHLVFCILYSRFVSSRAKSSAQPPRYVYEHTAHSDGIFKNEQKSSMLLKEMWMMMMMMLSSFTYSKIVTKLRNFVERVLTIIIDESSWHCAVNSVISIIFDIITHTSMKTDAPRTVRE